MNLLRTGLGVSGDYTATAGSQSSDCGPETRAEANREHLDPFWKMAMSNPTGFVSLMTAPPANAIPLIDRMVARGTAHPTMNRQGEDDEQETHRRTDSDQRHNGRDPTELHDEGRAHVEQVDTSRTAGEKVGISTHMNFLHR